MQQILAIFRRWLAILAQLFIDWQVLVQSRKSFVVRKEDGYFVIRRAGTADNNVLARVAAGTHATAEVNRLLRKQSISFELSAGDLVSRRITVPAQAEEFLPGIVRNQIERLSPWPPHQAVYGFSAKPNQQEPGTLNVGVQIAARSAIEAMRDELATCGLAPNRICVRADGDIEGAPVALWTRSDEEKRRTSQSLPRVIGMGLAAMVALSAGVSLWALYSANGIDAEREEMATRRLALERHAHASGRPQDLAALKPTERAWALKEESPVTVLVLDSLAHALPESAYLTELHFENATLRLIGLASDAPSLIAALEQHGHFSNVHFFAPTTKGAEGALYRFFIEAHVDPHVEGVKG